MRGDSVVAFEREFIEVCKEVPPDFSKIKSLLESGVDINSKNKYGDSLVSEIILGYPHEARCCEDCENNCDDCEQNDASYLPKLIEFLLSCGWDSHDTGCDVLSALCFSSYTRDVFDAAKVICSAGMGADAKSIEDLMSTLGTKVSFNRCEGDHDLENLFEAFYELVDHARQHQPFAHIDTYHAAIGLTIDSIVVFGADTGVCTDDLGRTTYAHDSGLVCGDKTVIIKKDVNVLLMNGLQNMLPCVAADDIFNAPVCGRTITKISFAHNTVIKGPVHYGQPVINLHLDDGAIISFTHNYGELPKGECVSRFSVAR